MNKIYFDNASTTQVRPEVIEEMLPYFNTNYGNPSGLHSFSRVSKKAYDSSREKIAGLIGAEPEEVIFTSGGTEATNLALQGFLRYRNNKKDHILASKIEHDSVRSVCNQLELEGWDYNRVEVNNLGQVILDDLHLLIKPETVLVSIMHGNNEIGTIQPLKRISQVLKERETPIIFHTDAVQTLGKLPFNVRELGVDMASFSAHKLYGPKGIGALYTKKEIKLKPLIYGGGQEWNLRSGTGNVALAVGFAKALELAVKEQEETKHRLHRFQKLIHEHLMQEEKIFLNGPEDFSDRIPGNLSYTLKDIEGDSLLLHLDLKGVAISSGSACSSNKVGISHVIKTLGYDDSEKFATIRITLGRYNNEDECEYFIESIKSIFRDLRSVRIS